LSTQLTGLNDLPVICRHYTEKNAIFRKILILLKIISKIIICFSKLLFEPVQILFSFVTNWDFRCIHRYCFASEQLNLLKTKYFSERSLFVSWHSPLVSADKVDASFCSAVGGRGFTGTLGMYEFFSVLSLFESTLHLS
jgi:hypothetical protein